MDLASSDTTSCGFGLLTGKVKRSKCMQHKTDTQHNTRYLGQFSTAENGQESDGVQ